MILTIVVIALLIAADQLTKYIAVLLLKEGSACVIDGVFRFVYVENRGAAFGMLADHRWIFMTVSTAAVILIVLYIWKDNPKAVSLRYGLALMAAGGAGNMVDRIARGFVVDFIELSFVKYPAYSGGNWEWVTFPVFNFADMCVTFGCVMVIYHVLVNEIILVKVRKNKA